MLIKLVCCVAFFGAQVSGDISVNLHDRLQGFHRMMDLVIDTPTVSRLFPCVIIFGLGFLPPEISTSVLGVGLS